MLVCLFVDTRMGGKRARALLRMSLSLVNIFEEGQRSADALTDRRCAGGVTFQMRSCMRGRAECVTVILKQVQGPNLRRFQVLAIQGAGWPLLGHHAG